MEPQDILIAMYGDEIARIKKTWDTLFTPNTDHRFGGNRKLDHKHNRSVSAFAWLHELTDGNINLFLYHSDYADIPLGFNSAMKIADAQFRRISGSNHNYREWETIYE